MENWGLITGRTSVYLYDEKKSGIAAKKRVIGVQSHEVAHQVRPPSFFLIYLIVGLILVALFLLSGSVTSSLWIGGTTCGKSSFFETSRSVLTPVVVSIRLKFVHSPRTFESKLAN